MARQSTTKPVEATVAAEDAAVADIAETVEDVNADVKKPVARKSAAKDKPSKIENDEVVEVASMIPNVSYKDSHTGDIYKWEEVGHVEDMTFEVLQNMWRSSKSYFKNMWLKPCDDRVIKKFGLESMYGKYDFLMDKSNYTKDNIETICDSIVSTPGSLKLSLCNKVKSMVASGDVSDISVIRAMEKKLKIDLISLVG